MNTHDMSWMSRGGTETGGGAGALIGLGTVGPSLLHHFYGDHHYLTRNWVIVGSILLLGPLGFFKSMRRFAVPSMVAVWMVLALCFCIIVKAITVYAGDGPHPVAPPGSFSFAQASFFPALGGTCFLFLKPCTCSVA
jgi:amino acid permease